LYRVEREPGRFAVGCACLPGESGRAENEKETPCGKTEASAYGRIETRVGVVVEAKGLAECHDFPGLKAFGRVETTRVIDGRTETDWRICVLSPKLPPQALLERARAPWKIENGLHWQPDVSFGEDAAAARSTSPASIRARDR